MKRSLKILLAVFIFQPPALQAADSAGETAAAFLEIAPGARPMGLGGAFTAVADDINALYYNAGGIGFLRSNEVTFAYANTFESINYGYAGFVQPLKRAGTLGISATVLDSGDINKTDEDSLGNFSTQDGKFNTRDIAVTLSYGISLGKTVGLGITARQINQKVDSSSLSGWSFDGGTLLRTPVKGLILGAAATNVGPKMDGHKLPTTLTGGVSYSPVKHLTLASDVVKPLENETAVHAGLEILPIDFVALRGGYKSDSDIGSNFYAGMGFMLPQTSLDYAFTQSNEFSNTHRISLRFKF